MSIISGAASQLYTTADFSQGVAYIAVFASEERLHSDDGPRICPFRRHL